MSASALAMFSAVTRDWFATNHAFFVLRSSTTRGTSAVADGGEMESERRADSVGRGTLSWVLAEGSAGVEVLEPPLFLAFFPFPTK